MAKVDTRSHKHFVWDASVSTVLHPFVDQAPQESFLQEEGRGSLEDYSQRWHDFTLIDIASWFSLNYLFESREP